MEGETEYRTNDAVFSNNRGIERKCLIDIGSRLLPWCLEWARLLAGRVRAAAPGGD